MNNPYLSRGPVRDPGMLFGRTHELHEIAAFLRGTQSVSIIGPRKIGKTSLLLQLMRPAAWPGLGLGDDNLFVYLDCEVLGEGAHAEIFGQFAAEIAAALEERGLPPEPALDAAAAKPTRLALEAAIRKLNQGGVRIVLILDEFERLATNGQLDLNFFNALRSIAARYQFVFLTASARPLIELTYSGRSQEILSSPFFNIFAPVFLGLLAEDDARRLMREPARQQDVAFSATTEDFLYALAGGHPFALQVACFHAFDTRADHAETERRTIRELDAHFQYTWHNLSPAEQNVLRNLNDLALHASGDTALRGLLRDLVQKCLLVGEGKAPEGGPPLRYRYPSRAWAQFVAAQQGQASVRKTTSTEAISGLTQPSHGATRPQVALAGGSLIGSRFGPYELYERMGHGGMADVYRGHHTRLDRTVAIKVLPAHLANHGDFRARFEREARAVATLKHPNIVQVYDFGDVDGIYYMVMEYIAGTDLAQALSEHGALPLEQARVLICDVAAALDYAHARGLVHRDVKPSNVMVQPATFSENQRVRAVLTDFGIAKILAGVGDTTRTGVMLGTPDYMAPEQIRAIGEVDARADVYALGVMLFQMLTGQLPFAGGNPGAVVLAHLHQPPPDPRTLRPDLPARVTMAVLRALAKNPAERYQTAGALASALDAD